MSRTDRFTGSAALIALLTLLSRVLGLVREMVFGYFFGASPLLSAFRIAFQVPNLARRLFGEGALTSSFIPVFTRCREHEGDESARRLAGGVLTILSAVLTVLLLLGELGLLVTGRFTWNPTLTLTAIMLPYMLLICLTALVAGLLNALNRFAAPAMAPSILNMVLVLAAVLGAWGSGWDADQQMLLIAASVPVGGALQLASQVWWLRSSGFWPQLNLVWSSPPVRQVMRMMAPMMLGMSAVGISSLADSLVAMIFVADGRGPAILGYAQYLYQLPLGLFGIALATAVFPLFARYAARGEMDAFARSVAEGARICLFIAVPSGVGLILVARPLVRVMFERGEFGADDSARVAASLVCYSLGLWAYSLQHILVRAFYSMEDSRTPMRVTLSTILLNQVLNVILVFPLQEAGISLATASCAMLQVTILAIRLKRKVPALRARPIIHGALRTAAASAAMAAILLLVNSVLPVHWRGNSLGLAVSLVAGAGTFFLAARFLNRGELGLLLGRSSSPEGSTHRG